MGTTHRHAAKRSTGWIELGTITTDSAMFAIVDPCKADVLADRWFDRMDRLGLERGRVDALPRFDEWRLTRDGAAWTGASTVLFDTGPEGGHAIVEGRFGPYLGEVGDPDHADDSSTARRAPDPPQRLRLRRPRLRPDEPTPASVPDRQEEQMNPGDVDALMAKIRTVLAEDQADMVIGELHLDVKLDGVRRTLRIPVSAAQFVGLVRDMAGVVGIDPAAPREA